MILYEYYIENTYHSTDDINKIPEGVVYITSEIPDTEEVEEIKVPLEVALWKIRVIIKSMGLEEQIEQSFELLEEPNKTGAKYIWEYGTSIERYSQTVLFLQQVLKLKDNQVDEIFKSANDIKL